MKHRVTNYGTIIDKAPKTVIQKWDLHQSFVRIFATVHTPNNNLSLRREIVPFLLKLQAPTENNKTTATITRRTQNKAPPKNQSCTICVYFSLSLTLCDSRRCDTKAFSEPALSGWCRWVSRRWCHHLLTFICAAPYRLPPDRLSYTCTIYFVLHNKQTIIQTLKTTRDDKNKSKCGSGSYLGMRRPVRQYLWSLLGRWWGGLGDRDVGRDPWHLRCLWRIGGIFGFGWLLPVWSDLQDFQWCSKIYTNFALCNHWTFLVVSDHRHLNKTVFLCNFTYKQF